MSEWKDYKLRDLTSKIGSGATPRGGSNSYIASGISLIRSQNVLDFKFSESGLAFIDDDQANELKNVKVAGNDILLNITGDSVARCCIVPSQFLPARVNQHVSIIRPIPGKADFKFVFYYLQYLKPELLINAEIGATRNAITKGMIEEIEISLPEMNEQRAIASVLSGLDDKIDLLHRQNATLESMAETLFRQWFVVEAKEDWEEVKLSDLVVVKYGKDHKNLLDGIIPVFGSGGIMRYADKALYDKESVLIPRKGTLSNVFYIDEPFWSVDTMFYTEMKRQNLAKFIFYFVKGLDLASMNVGSAVPSMTTEVLNNLPIDIPSDAVLALFEQALAPLYKKVKSNKTQIHTLTGLRDMVLPKLMSGEVRVV
jgi:type I restriction enzyme S subunit